MDYPPTYETFAAGRAPPRGEASSGRREALARWLGVAALVCLAAGMGLTVIDIEMSSANLLMLALPNLEMTGKQVFGPLGVLASGITMVFVLALFSRRLSTRRRPFGVAAIALWLATFVLAAMEVHTAFEATLATISILNRGEIALDLRAQLTPTIALWMSLLGVFFLIASVVACRRVERADGT